MSSARTSPGAASFYDHAAPDSDQPGFRRGDAGFVIPDEHWGFTGTSVVDIPPNALHALEQHGVVAELNALEFQTDSIVAGRDAVLIAERGRLSRQQDRIEGHDHHGFGRVDGETGREIEIDRAAQRPAAEPLRRSSRVGNLDELGRAAGRVIVNLRDLHRTDPRQCIGGRGREERERCKIADAVR